MQEYNEEDMVMGDRKTGQLSRDQILRLVLTALFAAICFVVIWLKIPIGEQFVHPGLSLIHI